MNELVIGEIYSVKIPHRYYFLKYTGILEGNYNYYKFRMFGMEYRASRTGTPINFVKVSKDIELILNRLLEVKVGYKEEQLICEILTFIE